MREEGAMDILRRIMSFLDVIRDIVLYFKWYRPMKTMRDPDERLEKKLLFELTGVRYGGMAMSGAYVSFKKDYYDTITSADEKWNIRRALLRMLRSPRYTVSQKEMIAYICSDIGMNEAATDIAFVREAVAREMTLRQLYRFKLDQERERRKHKLSKMDSRYLSTDCRDKLGGMTE
jgi:hypothetical protein